MYMPYVLLVLHAVSITYIDTVFLFRQTHRINIGPVSTGQNCTNPMDFSGDSTFLSQNCMNLMDFS